ncbi:ABC transporter ATP-binding protein [Corynebacterium propinquum]
MASFSTSTEPLSVSFRGINKSYTPGGPLVLRDLDLDIEADELLTVLGPSGCGKTTTLRILAGFENPNSGDVLVGGNSIVSTPASKRNMGMVFQSYSLFPNLSVAENIEYGLRIRKRNKAASRKRCEELLEMCGLPDYGDRRPEQLSGGQQQRVALARALAIEPQVLLLDEPLSALDATVRAQLRDEIRNVQQTMGTTTMFITHDQAEALVMADRVAVLNGGVVEQHAAPKQLYSRPETPFVARFVGSINEFSVPASWQPADNIPVNLPQAHADDVVFVRPEALRLAADENSAARVTNHAYLGDHIRVTVEHDNARTGSWTVQVASREAAEVPVGSRVSVSLIDDIALRLPASEVGE